MFRYFSKYDEVPSWLLEYKADKAKVLFGASMFIIKYHGVYICLIPNRSFSSAFTIDQVDESLEIISQKKITFTSGWSCLNLPRVFKYVKELDAKGKFV